MLAGLGGQGGWEGGAGEEGEGRGGRRLAEASHFVDACFQSDAPGPRRGPQRLPLPYGRVSPLVRTCDGPDGKMLFAGRSISSRGEHAHGVCTHTG